VKWELSVCPFNSEHTGGCAVITRCTDGTIGFKCQHNSCIDKGWREVRTLLEGPRPYYEPNARGTGTGPQTNARAADATLVTRRIADIEPKPVRWLWRERIARGKVTILAGDPGLGKSQVTASVAAVVTTGGLWPVDRSTCELGDIIFLSAEDDPADTIRPRLEAAGADLQRIHIVEGVIVGYKGDGTAARRAFSLEEDVQVLDATLSRLMNVAMVVIDPISAYLGRTDSHKNAEVRALLAPVSELAARHNVAIVGVSHLSKATGSKGLMRVTGSLAFVAAARAAYLVAADPANPARRLFLPLKNNIGPDTTGLAFIIEATTVQSPAGELKTSRVAWESAAVTLTADEVLKADDATKTSPALSEAIEWLRQILAKEPMSAREIYTCAEEDGIARKTLQRAADSLRVRKQKTSMKGGWTWSLPPKMANSAEDAQGKSLGIFGEFGHLRESEPMVELEIDDSVNGDTNDSAGGLGGECGGQAEGDVP
jgi:hypothetical protein